VNFSHPYLILPPASGRSSSYNPRSASRLMLRPLRISLGAAHDIKPTPRPLFSLSPVILGVTVRFVWKGYKIAKSAPAISSYEGNEKKPFKIPQPATHPQLGRKSIRRPTSRRRYSNAGSNPPSRSSSILAHRSSESSPTTPPARPIAQGSGFLITTSGLVVTNYHIVKGSSSSGDVL